MGWALRTFASRDRNTIMTLYNSLIQPHLEYNTVLTNPKLKKDIAKIERVQKSTTHRIYSLKTTDYWGRLKSLKVYSLERRRERYAIIYTWKITQKLVPNLPTYPITTYIDRRKGRLCKIPTLKEKCPKKARTLREDSLAVRGPKLFNSLPADLRNLNSEKVSTFKRALDKFLVNIPDEPVIDTYAARNFENSNSLIVMIPSHNRQERRY